MKLAVLPAVTDTPTGWVVINGPVPGTVSLASPVVTVFPAPVSTHRNRYPLWATDAVKRRFAVLFPLAPELVQVLPPSLLACH